MSEFLQKLRTALLEYADEEHWGEYCKGIDGKRRLIWYGENEGPELARAALESEDDRDESCRGFVNGCQCATCLRTEEVGRYR